VSRSGTTTRDRVRGGRRTAERRAAGRVGGRVGGVTTLPSRRRSTARRPPRRTLRIALVLVLLAVVAWALWMGPLLVVRSVQVDGARTLPADQVREAAGIVDGTPLLRVDVAAAEARVARLPQVASVEVTRGWPSSVVITVAERVPVAVVGEPGRRSLIDGSGVLFDSVSGDPPPGVVPVKVPSPGPGDPATRAVLEALLAVPADVRARIALASADDADAISLTLDDGTAVIWGGPGGSATKGTALTALLEQIESGRLEPAETIDVSTPDAVVLR
jgi:cell division protein FtsQ